MSEGVQKSKPVYIIYTLTAEDRFHDLLNKAQMSGQEWLKLQEEARKGGLILGSDECLFIDPKSTCERDRGDYLASLMQASQHSTQLRERVQKSFNCDRFSSFWQDRMWWCNSGR